MNTLLQTAAFTDWLQDLKDSVGRARVLLRLRAMETSHFGDAAAVGDGVSELRIHIGPGYRIYYARQQQAVYLLLVGGTKSSQKHDIKQAKQLWKLVQAAPAA